MIKIVECMGEPTDRDWPGWQELRESHKFRLKPHAATPLNLVIRAASADALALLGKLLRYDPNKRITAEQALNDPYFTSNPLPSSNAALAQRVSDYLADKAQAKKDARAAVGGAARVKEEPVEAKEEGESAAGSKRKHAGLAESPRYG